MASANLKCSSRNSAKRVRAGTRYSAPRTDLNTDSASSLYCSPMLERRTPLSKRILIQKALRSRIYRCNGSPDWLQRSNCSAPECSEPGTNLENDNERATCHAMQRYWLRRVRANVLVEERNSFGRINATRSINNKLKRAIVLQRTRRQINAQHTGPECFTSAMASPSWKIPLNRSSLSSSLLTWDRTRPLIRSTYSRRY